MWGIVSGICFQGKGESGEHGTLDLGSASGDHCFRITSEAEGEILLLLAAAVFIEISDDFSKGCVEIEAVIRLDDEVLGAKEPGESRERKGEGAEETSSGKRIGSGKIQFERTADATAKEEDFFFKRIDVGFSTARAGIGIGERSEGSIKTMLEGVLIAIRSAALATWSRGRHVDIIE